MSMLARTPTPAYPRQLRHCLTCVDEFVLFLAQIFIDASVAQWILGKEAFGDFLSVNIASGIGLTIGIYTAGGVSGECVTYGQ